MEQLIKVYGLTGKSGTGKSYQSMNICRDRGIESIIDDGLFIYKNAVQAGHSAKRDDNKMTAIKTAIFQNEESRKEVADKIKELKPASILVLGTSEGMIEKICTRLELPEVSEMIYIEDVVDEDAIATALRQRREMGKHVIPVATFEIKPQFSGYFMLPLNIFRGMGRNRITENEKTVVRPTYSYMGKFRISDKAVQQLVRYVCNKSEGMAEVKKITVSSREEGVILTVVGVFDYSRNLRKNIAEMQRMIAEEVENMTAFHILRINVIVKGLKPISKGKVR